MLTKKVSIIIPNWNGRSFFKDCLNSLKRLNYENYEVVVVDNGSSDNSVEYIKKEFPDTIILCMKENLGFAGGCNAGIKYAFENGADFAVLLNNDTEVENNFLSKMVKTAEDENVGLVGCKINYFDERDKIWFAGGDYIKWRCSGKHKNWMQKDIGLTGEIGCDFITGCVMLIKKEVVDEIGYMFEPYFLTVEDLDFSLTAKKAGWKIKTNLDAIVYHKVSFSRSGEFSFSNGYYGTRNRLHFAFRRIHNYSGGLMLLFVIMPIRIVQWTILGQHQMVEGAVLGIKDFLLNKLGKK